MHEEEAAEKRFGRRNAITAASTNPHTAFAGAARDRAAIEGGLARLRVGTVDREEATSPKN